MIINAFGINFIQLRAGVGSAMQKAKKKDVLSMRGEFISEEINNNG